MSWFARRAGIRIVRGQYYAAAAGGAGERAGSSGAATLNPDSLLRGCQQWQGSNKRNVLCVEMHAGDPKARIEGKNAQASDMDREEIQGREMKVQLRKERCSTCILVGRCRRGCGMVKLERGSDIMYAEETLSCSQSGTVAVNHLQYSACGR